MFKLFSRICRLQNSYRPDTKPDIRGGCEVEPPISLHAQPYANTVRGSGDKAKGLSRFAAWVSGAEPSDAVENFKQFYLKHEKLQF